MQRGKADEVRDYIVGLIEENLSPHAKLPTERELASDLEVSRLTVRRVLDKLVNEQLVYRVQGSGTFVSEPCISKSLELTSFTEDMRQRGHVPGSRLLVAEQIPAGASFGYPLNLSPDEPVVHLCRVRTADDVPMCLEHSYLPAHLVPGILDQPPGDQSLYQLMADVFRIRLQHAEQTIRSTVLSRETAALLEVPAFSPALEVERTAYDPRGRAVEHALSTYRGDRYSYHVVVRRQGGA